MVGSQKRCLTVGHCRLGSPVVFRVLEVSLAPVCGQRVISSKPLRKHRPTRRCGMIGRRKLYGLYGDGIGVYNIGQGIQSELYEKGEKGIYLISAQHQHKSKGLSAFNQPLPIQKHLFFINS